MNEQVAELTPEQERLVAEHMPLVKLIAYYEAKRHPSFEQEEFLSLGFMALIDTAQRFDRDKGDDFTMFARKRLRGIMRDAVRAARRPTATAAAGVAESQFSADANDLSRIGPPQDLDAFIDPTTSMGTKFGRAQMRTIVAAVRETLAPDDRAMADALWVEGLSPRQYADRIGKSKTFVYKYANQLATRLRAAIVARSE